MTTSWVHCNICCGCSYPCTLLPGCKSVAANVLQRHLCECLLPQMHHLNFLLMRGLYITAICLVGTECIMLLWTCRCGLPPRCRHDTWRPQVSQCAAEVDWHGCQRLHLQGTEIPPELPTHLCLVNPCVFKYPDRVRPGKCCRGGGATNVSVQLCMLRLSASIISFDVFCTPVMTGVDGPKSQR